MVEDIFHVKKYLNVLTIKPQTNKKILFIPHEGFQIVGAIFFFPFKASVIFFPPSPVGRDVGVTLVQKKKEKKESAH